MTSTRPRVETRTDADTRTRKPPPWRVVLLDDDDHTYEYVMEMVMSLFSLPIEKAFEVAKTVDAHGRAVCMTTHKELAELKRDQILAFGKDRHIASCKGSMSAIIEPAEGEQ